MADFDPFANQGGPAAWDPEHASDVKKQAEELNRRLAADLDESGNDPSPFDDGADEDRADEDGAGDDSADDTFTYASSTEDELLDTEEDS